MEKTELVHDAIQAQLESELIAPRTRITGVLIRPVEFAGAALLLLLIILVLIGVLFRYFLSAPIIWIDEAATFTFLWLSMLGSVIAIDRAEHLRLTLFLRFIPEYLQSLVQTFALVCMAGFLLALINPAVEHAIFESVVMSPALDVSQGYRIAAIAFGFILMFAITAFQILKYSSPRDIAISVLIAGLICLLFWLQKPALLNLGQANILIFLVVVSAICLVIGVPIAFCFGIGTLTFLFFSTNLPVSVIIGRMDEGMSHLILLSVPVFVLLGCILDGTGMGKAIVDFLSSLIGHVRAGMSYVLLGSLYLVSGISGSKISDMATVAPALFPEMKRRGNRPSEMVALLATGAVMADTVPPSIVLIVLGSVASLSIAGLFTSGFVIAFVLLMALAIVARWKSGRESLADVKRAPTSLMVRTMIVAAPALVLPFMIRSLIGGGVATATEVSTVAVVYALLVGIVLYGGITPSKFYDMLVETAALSGAIMLIMGTALAAAWALTQTGFASNLAAMMKELPGGWISFMGVTILTFLVLGCLLEGLPALVLLAPLMFPIAKDLGIHGIHYAMVVVVSMNIGLFTPPIGIGFYIACSIGKVEPDEAIKAVWIYLLALIAGLLVIALVPAISIAYL
jgi:tripartite ATP-independent transporter DctM subunit